MVLTSKLCNLCKTNIGKKFKLQCGVCKSYFHLQCGNVTEVDARIMQAEKTPWSCKNCSPTQTSSSSRRSLGFSQNAPPAEDPELKSLIKELQLELREIRKSMDFLNEMYEEEKKRSNVLVDMVNEISKENNVLKQEVNQLKTILNVREQDNIKNNICVSGLIASEDDKDSTATNLSKLFNALNAPVSEAVLSNLNYLNTKNSGIKVIVTLPTTELKKLILEARAKKGKLTLRNCGLGEASTPIFISEDLTKQTYALFKRAKLLKEHGYKYIWYRNGNVLARKDDGQPVVAIKNEAVLDGLLG
ncbi:unnamed protein product [Ceutorhynchus assimilis]|uniref:PHD-type domain-containing protein n=1 Tax=Ceutorhynchus assimilis TaxID=467358 RepID=A0A9N9QKG3_9CUCU|nr:unnamed protein product [Ceutorhynchus assimilis]